jgi:hypothetical protein
LARPVNRGNEGVEKVCSWPHPAVSQTVSQLSYSQLQERGRETLNLLNAGCILEKSALAARRSDESDGEITNGTMEIAALGEVFAD